MRLLSLILGLLLASGLAFAQEKSARLGILSAGVPRTAPIYMAFEKRLSELGWVDGKTLRVEFRNAQGHADRLPALAKEIVQTGVDLIVAPGSEFTLRAARQASTSIPIVIIAVDYDPLLRGYVTSLARPKDNITGVSLRQIDLTDKRLELLKQVKPSARRVAVLWDVFSSDQLKAAVPVAASLKLELLPLELGKPDYDFESAFRQATREKADAVMVLAFPIAYRERQRVSQLALEHRLPMIAPLHEFAEAGGLMAYGGDLRQLARKAAEHADRLLRGAKPAELPIEQPTTFALTVNMKTAAALGLSIPPTVRLRADTIIE